MVSFNPRSREGSDCLEMFQQPISAGFNPRSREGSDFKASSGSPEQQRFNPRSREGSDYGLRETDWNKVVSIHAPAKGATVHLHHRSAE